MEIIKVIFTPKLRAPVNCREVVYLVNAQYEGLALEKAAEVFKQEHVNYKYYGEAIAARQRVI